MIEFTSRYNTTRTLLLPATGDTGWQGDALKCVNTAAFRAAGRGGAKLRSAATGGSRRRDAFTLMELLIVLSIFLVLTAVALPTVRSLVSDQKASKMARSIVAFFDESRGLAISKGQYVGVRIERLSDASSVEFGTSAAMRLRRLSGVPPYRGDTPGANVMVTVNSGTGKAQLDFPINDSFLLTLHSKPNAPIKDGDRIELAGGRTFPLKFEPMTTTHVVAEIDLLGNRASAYSSGDIPTFPLGARYVASGTAKYAIHRSPVASSAAPLPLTRGLAIDLNYSGIGVSGNQFAPQNGVTNQPIDILFGPDGRVEYASRHNEGDVGPPEGMIFLCLGTSDGVQPGSLFSTEKGAVANVMDPDSIWIVINPSTGRVVASPFAMISGTPANMAAALTTARSFARLSDTLDNEP
ncbi:MAG: Tfp pilus assembly protein FimT/FimU [Novipirellula sp. JB048]